MTTKEFSRKVEYWSNWLPAFDLFSMSTSYSFIWKFSILEVMSKTSIFYGLSPFFTHAKMLSLDIDTIVIERYTRDIFNLDLKYFKSFLSRLSSFQLEVLKNDSRFSSLVSYVSSK